MRFRGSEMSADNLRSRVDYCAETGLFTWKVKKGARRSGRPVGSPHSAGYVEMSVNRYRMFAHQAAWLFVTGEWPRAQVDHVNGNRTDNSWSNLRLAEQQQNSANMKRRASNQSGFKGVIKVRDDLFRAYIHVGGKTKYLGGFATAEAASAAYVAAAESAWGSFARAA